MAASSKKTTQTAIRSIPPGLALSHLVSCVVVYIIVDAALKFEHATEALAFYGVYHREPWNQFIHFFGVPGILLSLLIFLVHLPLPLLGNGNSSKNITYGSMLSLFYLGFYLNLDPIGGTLYAPLLYGMYKLAIYFKEKDQAKAQASGVTNCWCGTGKLFVWALVLHVLSWYVQIHLGHHIIEGAQPASLQNLGGALTVAPLFAFYEGMWLLGINNELQASTLALVDQLTQDLCTSGTVVMRACENVLVST